MKRPRISHFRCLLVVTVLFFLPSTSSTIFAQTIIGHDDFDGGGEYLSRSFSEVLGGGVTGPGEEAAVFGIFDRNVNAWFADDSLVDPTDQFGVIRSTKTDSFLAFQNTPELLQFGDSVSVQWVFDVAGYTDLKLSYDLAAMGGFAWLDKAHFFAFKDGAGLPSFVSRADGYTNVGTFPYSLENGTTVLLGNPLGFNDQIDNRFTTYSTSLPSGSDTLLISLSVAVKNEAAVVALDNLVITGVPPFVLGDCDQDGDVDFLDIAPFISTLSAAVFLEQADMDQSGVVDFLDIQPFIDLLSSQ